MCRYAVKLLGNDELVITDFEPDPNIGNRRSGGKVDKRLTDVQRTVFFGYDNISQLEP